MQPDQTDWKIISILKEGYVPNNTIARKLGISEGTVRARLKRLKEAGILQIRALINPDVLENQQLVIVAIRVAESKLLERKAEELSQALERALRLHRLGPLRSHRRGAPGFQPGSRAVPHGGAFHHRGHPCLGELHHAEKLPEVRLIAQRTRRARRAPGAPSGALGPRYASCSCGSGNRWTPPQAGWPP